MNRFLKMMLSSIIIFFSWAGFCYAENLTFTMLDVGQADSLLIQTAGKIVLIDAGEDKELVKTKLEERHITNLDLVVTTHPHSDHMGGMLSVVENTNIKVYMDNGFPHTTKQYEKLMEAAEEKVAGGMRYMAGRQGQRLNLGKEAHFEILWPDNEGFKNTRSDINANSIVMKLVHGNVCFLLMGDAEAETEQAVTPLVDKCQILKVSHHGTPHSSIPEFLDKVMPETALISVGLANKHGHPGKSTLEALEARNAKLYRTDWMGEITVVSDGTHYTVTTEKNLTKADLPCIDINRATERDFSELNGIGKTTTDRIFAARSSHMGPYSTVEDFLADLPHDTAHRLEKMREYLATDCSHKFAGNVPAPRPGMPPHSPGMLPPPGMQPHAPSMPPQAPGSGRKININTADAHLLMQMPGITAKRANDIIEYRNANGLFASCADLQNVKGIGVKTVAKLHMSCTTTDEGTQGHPGLPAGAPPIPPSNMPQRPAGAPPLPPAGMMPPSGAPALPPSNPEARPAYGAVNINTATADIIATMPGMTKKRAESAVEYRNANGPFKSCQELQNVKGIGPKTVGKLLPSCTVE